MPPWLELTNGFASIPLQVAGFWIAIWQIKKTRNAAQAAESAAKGAAGQIEAKLLLVILPQLNQVESNLELAASRGDRDATMQYLGAWRWQAGQLRGHLADRADPELVKLIQSSIVTAATTKLSIQDPASDVAKRAKAAQRAISSVTGKLGELSARNTTETMEKR